MLVTRTVNMISDSDWDALVGSTYQRPYCFQQQDGCQERGIRHFSVPDNHPWDCENDTIPEKVNGEKMGVSFNAWLSRDPKQKPKNWDNSDLELFWQRNFYPNLEMIASDLYKRGLLPAGEYVIEIDW